MQIVSASAFRGWVLGNVTNVNGALRFLPLSGRTSIVEYIDPAELVVARRKISYRAFEQAVHIAFESGMAWVFPCRHLTPNTALLVIPRGTVVSVSSGRNGVHAVLFGQDHVWSAWMQLCIHSSHRQELWCYGVTCSSRRPKIRCSARIQSYSTIKACM